VPAGTSLRDPASKHEGEARRGNPRATSGEVRAEQATARPEESEPIRRNPLTGIGVGWYPHPDDASPSWWKARMTCTHRGEKHADPPLGDSLVTW